MNKKLLYKIHKWAGLTLGLFFFILGLSGLAITFREELLPKSYPHLFNITPQKSFLPTYALYEKALTHKTITQEVTNIYSSHHDDEAYMLMVKDSTKRFPLIWTINPYTGEILGEISMIKNFYAVMLMLHTNFLSGKIGSYFVGILGLVLSFFIISGLIIFLPVSQKSKKLKSLLSFSTSAQKIHHQLGVLTAPLLLLSALSGMFIVFDIPYYVARVFNAPPRIEEAVIPGECTREEQIAVLKNMSSEIENKLVSIHLCTAKNSLMKITYGKTEKDFAEGYVREIIDPKVNLPIQVFDSDLDPKSWNLKRLIIYPIHTGQFFGIIGRVINFFLGLSLCLLVVSGIWLSIKRARLKSIN